MNRIQRTTALLIGAAVMLGGCDPEEKPTGKSAHVTKVKIPRILSPQAKRGAQIYSEKCLSCHGVNTGGTNKGPALIGYDRRHHSDGAFFKAAREGVKQHHWSFGDMPAIPSIGDQDIESILVYVRELQAFQNDEDDNQ